MLQLPAVLSIDIAVSTSLISPCSAGFRLVEAVSCPHVGGPIVISKKFIIKDKKITK